MSTEPEVTPLFSRCAGVLSTVCENFLPRHPRLAGVLSGRFAALNVSPMTAERFLKTLVEQAELETLCDLDLVASVKLEQEIAKAGYYALMRALLRKAGVRNLLITHVVILALRLRQKFVATDTPGVLDTVERDDVSASQIQALRRLYVYVVNALKTKEPAFPSQPLRDSLPV